MTNYFFSFEKFDCIFALYDNVTINLKIQKKLKKLKN